MHPAEGARATAGHERGVARVRLAQQIVRILQADDRVAHRIALGDAIQIGQHHLAA